MYLDNGKCTEWAFGHTWSYAGLLLLIRGMGIGGLFNYRWRWRNGFHVPLCLQKPLSRSCCTGTTDAIIIASSMYTAKPWMRKPFEFDVARYQFARSPHWGALISWWPLPPVNFECKEYFDVRSIWYRLCLGPPRLSRIADVERKLESYLNLKSMGSSDTSLLSASDGSVTLPIQLISCSH